MQTYESAFVQRQEDQLFLFNPYTDTTAKIPYVGDVHSSIAPLREELRRSGILIPDKKDAAKVSDLFLARERTRTNVLGIVEAMTFNCNLRCVYCFEQNTQKVRSMPALERARLWESLRVAVGAKRVGITLFGGEPFINMNYLESVFQAAADQGTEVAGVCAITNGTLINDRVISFINSQPFRFVQITLDGTEEIHNSRRIMRKGDSFAATIAGMRRILECTSSRVYVNTVIDNSNADDYRNLVKYIVNEFPEYVEGEKARVIFNLGNECQPAEVNDFVTDHSFVGTDQEVRRYEELEWVLSQGLSVANPLPGEMCAKDSFGEVVLSPDGSVYDCITGIGLDGRKVCDSATVTGSPETFIMAQAIATAPRKNEACRECDYYALCNGGCAYGAMVDGSGVSCQRASFDATVEEMVSIRSRIHETRLGVFRQGDPA